MGGSLLSMGLLCFRIGPTQFSQIGPMKLTTLAKAGMIKT